MTRRVSGLRFKGCSIPLSGSSRWRGLALAQSVIVLVGVALAGGAVTGLALADVVQSVSQKGREFRPGEITIKRGQSVAIVNDDADLLHHAYLRTTAFSFDSGDQKPGSRFEVMFPEAGTFTVRCAIHPKMKLVVTVQ
jgi:plastocyanin